MEGSRATRAQEDAYMAKKILKNIERSKALVLADLVVYQPGQIVSKTIVQNAHVSLTLFAFDTDEEISTHASGGDAVVTVLDGRARITISGQEHVVSAGQTIVMPAEEPHALLAIEPMKFLLTVVF